MNISKKTKIVCTIGPASDNYKTCLDLYNSGMNVMRINFSHGTYDEHLSKIKIADELFEKKGIIIPVMLDTKGPEIRTGLVEDDKTIKIKKGETVEVSVDDSFVRLRLVKKIVIFQFRGKMLQKKFLKVLAFLLPTD